MDIVAYAKAHPWITGTVVVVGGIVFIGISGVFSGGGDGGSSDSGPSDAEISAQAQVAAAQIAAQAAQAQAGASLQAAQIGAGVQMNSDNLQAQVAMRELEVNQALGLSSTEAQRQVGLAQIDAQKAVNIAQTNAQVEVNRIIAGGNTAQAKAASKSSMFSTLGSIATAAFAIFSDDRLKENIVRVGTSENGYGIYEFNYKGDTKRQRGVIAQEVMKYRPDLVIENRRGFLLVKPQALAA